MVFGTSSLRIVRVREGPFNFQGGAMGFFSKEIF
jgi:hypothetical protein